MPIVGTGFALGAGLVVGEACSVVPQALIPGARLGATVTEGVGVTLFPGNVRIGDALGETPGVAVAKVFTGDGDVVAPGKVRVGDALGETLGPGVTLFPGNVRVGDALGVGDTLGDLPAVGDTLGD